MSSHPFRLSKTSAVLSLLMLLLLVISIPAAASAVELSVPAYGQRYSIRIPSDINPHNTEIWNDPYAPQDCGIACLSMLEAYHTGDYSENDFVYYSMLAAVNPNAAWTTTTTDLSLSADPTLISRSAYALYSSFTPEQILAQLNAGIPVMVYKGGIHWVVIYGYDGPSNYVNWGSFKIMSPYYSKNGGGVTYQYLSQFIGNYYELTRFMFRTGGVLPMRGANYGKTITAKLQMGSGNSVLTATADGNVVLAADTNSASQEWKFIQRSNSTYLLINLRYGLALDLANGSTSNGTNIGLFTMWDNYNPTQVYQRWYLYYVGDGYYRLSPEAAVSRALTGENWSTSTGTNLLLYDYSKSSAQHMKLIMLEGDRLQSITTSQSKLKLKQGETANLRVSYAPESIHERMRGVIWTSSNSAVATVDSLGHVTACGMGTCVITATSAYDDSLTSACTVTVETGLNIPQIVSLSILGHSVHVSWNASPLMDASDVRGYEVYVSPKGKTDEYVWSNLNVTGTSCDFTIDKHGEYEVHVRAVNKSNNTYSTFSSKAFTLLDDEWLYVDELPDSLPGASSGVEIQYLNHYNDRVQEESPGEGWTRGERNVTYVNGNILYSEDPSPLQESDTLVPLGTFYYHYCDGNNTVEHYWTERFRNVTRMDNYGQFDVVWQGVDDIDPRYTVYRLKWNSGEWAGGLATCAHGYSESMALYYLGYRYQERTAVVTYNWTKESTWGSEPDPNADSVSYRIRYLTIKHKLQLPAYLTKIEEEAFMNNTTIQEVTVPSGCTHIGSKAFAGCTELRRIYIPHSTVVASDAFEGASQVQIIRTGE